MEYAYVYTYVPAGPLRDGGPSDSPSSSASSCGPDPVIRTSAKLLSDAIYAHKTRKALRILRACPFLAWHVDESFRQTLHVKAAFAGNLEVLRALVDLNPAAALIRDYDHDDALKLAAIIGHLEIVEFLIDRVPRVCDSEDIWDSMEVLDLNTPTNIDHIVRKVAGVRNPWVIDDELASTENWRFAERVERVLRARPELAPFLGNTLAKAVEAGHPEIVQTIVDVCPALSRPALARAAVTSDSTEVVKTIIRVFPTSSQPPLARAIFLNACASPAPKVMMALQDLYGVSFDPEAQTLAAVHPAHIVGPIFRRFYNPSRLFNRQLGV